MSANTPGHTPISIDAISNLIEGGDKQLDCEAASEMLKWADEHHKDMEKGIDDLERKMQIMLVADLGIMYLLFRASELPINFALSSSWTEYAECLWHFLPLGAWLSAAIAIFCLVRGLLPASEFGLRGDRPANWSIQYLTLPSNEEGKASKNRGYILGYLCAKYSEKIQVTENTQNKKVRLYKCGFYAHCSLLILLATGVLLRILAGMAT